MKFFELCFSSNQVADPHDHPSVGWPALRPRFQRIRMRLAQSARAVEMKARHHFAAFLLLCRLNLSVSAHGVQIVPNDLGLLASSRISPSLHPLRISGSNLNSDLIQKLVCQFNRQDGEIDRNGFTNDELLDLHVQLNWLQHALMETFTSPRCEGTGVREGRSVRVTWSRYSCLNVA